MDDRERFNQQREEDGLLRRLDEADPEAWASVEVPLLLLGGEWLPEWLQPAAVHCLERGDVPAPWVTLLVEAWWQRNEGREMVWLLGRLAARSGQGSYEHRRCVLVLVLCARTLAAMAAERAAELQACFQTLESWAWGDSGVALEAALPQANSAHQAAKNAWNNAWQCEKIDETLNAWHEATAVAHCASQVAIDAACAAAADVSADFEELLAELVRSAVPVCPLLVSCDAMAWR